mmetsp:Transcript_14910/g.28056  ORF Transcript_14910/g.28056 Transcript_14910/m.28056 type:complete len:84 (-) Transcript_14910:600-851(-)
MRTLSSTKSLSLIITISSIITPLSSTTYTGKLLWSADDDSVGKTPVKIISLQYCNNSFYFNLSSNPKLTIQTKHQFMKYNIVI